MDKTNFSFAKFPIVKTVVQERISPWWYEIPNMSPKTPQSKFINEIKFFTSEQEAFNYWKILNPDADINTIEDYRRNWRKYKYQVWCNRVANCHYKGSHDYNFNILYCVVDKDRIVESNRLADDIRHYYIKWIKSMYTKEELKDMTKKHQELVGNDKCHWEQNITSSRRTWYF